MESERAQRLREDRGLGGTLLPLVLRAEELTALSRRDDSSTDYPPRFVVDGAHMPWSVEWAEYDKEVVDKGGTGRGRVPEYVADAVRSSPAGRADPTPLLVNWQQRYSRSKLAIEAFEPQTGRPRNPMGRTGLRNRGSLHQWGPNFSVDTIITRSDGRRAPAERLRPSSCSPSAVPTSAMAFLAAMIGGSSTATCGSSCPRMHVLRRSLRTS